MENKEKQRLMTEQFCIREAGNILLADISKYITKHGLDRNDSQNILFLIGAQIRHIIDNISREEYFDWNMLAKADGFIGNIKSIMEKLEEADKAK